MQKQEENVYCLKCKELLELLKLERTKVQAEPRFSKDKSKGYDHFFDYSKWQEWGVMISQQLQ